MNKWVFSLLLKTLTDEDNFISRGNVFHISAPAKPKALCPYDLLLASRFSGQSNRCLKLFLPCRKNQSMEYDIPQEHLLPQTSIVIKVAMHIANSWVLLIDQTGIKKKSKVNFIAFMNLHCLYVVIVMMHWYECIYSNCHVKAVQIPWKQWSLLQKSFSSLFDNQEYSRISHIHWYLDDNWYPE